MNLSAILPPERHVAMQKSYQCRSEPQAKNLFDYPHPSLSHRNAIGMGEGEDEIFRPTAFE